MFSSGIKSQGAGTLYYDSGALKSFFEDFLFFILAFRMGREGMSNSRIGHRRRTSEELEYLVLSLPPASLWGPWRPLTMCKIDHSSVFFKKCPSFCRVQTSSAFRMPCLVFPVVFPFGILPRAHYFFTPWPLQFSSSLLSLRMDSQT